MIRKSFPCQSFGRKPSKEDSSILRLLFFDELNGGLLQRFMLFLFNSRNVSCHFGKPVSIQSLPQDSKPADETAKKLWRVLKIHFRTQREAFLGPILYERKQVIKDVLRSQRVRDAIDSEARKSGRSFEKVEKKAFRYLEEITAHFSHNIVRLLELSVTWLCNKIFSAVEVRHSEEVRELAKTHELVYLPCHRSHFDYLLLPVVLFELGLMTPHTAGGINMNFGPLVGFCGAEGLFS